MVESFSEKEIVHYPNGGKTYFYTSDDVAIIVDDGICNLVCKDDSFAYSLITDKQNYYMSKYNSVYRFLIEDKDLILDYINKDNFDDNFITNKRVNDRKNDANISPLEYMFEQNFINVYGISATKYLDKEHLIIDDEGNHYFLDYFIRLKDRNIAIEENGVSYHHPQIIGIDNYRKQLKKQNTCAKWGIKLYRFSSEDCNFNNRIEDDIRRYFGNDCSQFIENGILANRGVTLYEHQSVTLNDIKNKRNEGINTFLVVFPTGSGKSKVVEEDILEFSKSVDNFKALILAPNRNIIDDWENRIEVSLNNLKDNITIKTYAYMFRNYTKFKIDEFDYIVIDEAHHAVAPMLKRVIQYFQPQFMIGLTATDQRPDKKKLESIFGSYKTELSLIQAMEKGIVANANVYRIETNIDLSKIRFNGKDYVNADLEKSIRVNSRNELIVDVIKKYFSDGAISQRQGVIFCVNTRHTQEMEKLLNCANISAKSYTGISKNQDKIMNDFKNKKIRFLCACNMISEGWDYRELGILVMARPTLSKVLYLQQLGRGLRKTDSKKNVFVIDVVDEYGAMCNPCSMHTIFKNACYVPFGNILNKNYHVGDIVEVDGLHETIEKITQVDINSFEDKYGDYLSQEQLAREYYVSTSTINSWIKKGKIKPSISYPFGNKQIYLFSPEDIERYRDELDIKVHNDDTIKNDFFDFLEERDYSLSYKMPFLLSLIKNINSIGDANIEDVLSDYIAFYKNRIDKGLLVDRKTCPYNKDNINDRKMLKRSMLTNPFEKFERKRFLYQSSDLGIISMNHALFTKMDKNDFFKVKQQMLEDLENYYKNLEE